MVEPTRCEKCGSEDFYELEGCDLNNTFTSEGQQADMIAHQLNGEAYFCCNDCNHCEWYETDRPMFEEEELND
jgi:hypothetical protein